MRHFLAIALLAAAACSHLDRGLMVSQYGHEIHHQSDTVPLIVATDSMSRDVVGDLIQTFSQEWNDALGFTMFFYIGAVPDDTPSTFMVRCVAAPEAVGLTILDFNEFTGVISKGRIELDCKAPRDALVKAVKHELGHLAGLAQDQLIDSVMAEENLSMRVTLHDKDVLNDAYRH